MNRYKLLGINVDSIEPDEIYDHILKMTSLNKSTQVILLDTYLLMKAKFNFEIRSIINSADLIIPISPLIHFGLNLFHKHLAKVYNYFNFIINLLLHFTESKKFIYILGGKKKLIDKADKNIRDSFPGIRLVGRYHSQYKKNFENDLMIAIRKACPALILVSKKSPDQERWIYQHKKNFNTGVFIGVNNFINIVGGKDNAPSDNAVHSGFKKMAVHPLRFFYYFSYIILLFIYKIFNKG